MSTSPDHHITQFPGVIAPYCLALEKSVGALVFRDGPAGAEFLVMQYPHGHWEFPRGHMEGGETEQDTMFREVWEETGLRKEDLTLIDGFRETTRFSYVARGDERRERKAAKRCLFIHKKVVFYLARTHTDAVVLSEEHTNFVWLPYEEALTKLTYENARRIIRAANVFVTKT